MTAMTGRSLHDALLRALCEAPLRSALASGDAAADAAIGVEEAAALRRADPVRLRRLARFMTRHFYRERLVRLFRHARAVLVRSGRDPIDLLGEPAFVGLLDGANLGSAETAGRVAAAIERRCREDAARAREAGREVPDYLEDLLGYGGALFRVEAGPRIWSDAPGASKTAAGAPGPPRLSPWARLIDLEHDLPPILDALEDLARPAPAAARRATRLLAALGPGGVVQVVRCPDRVAGLLRAFDGTRPLSQAAEAAGLSTAEAEVALKQLRALSAVVP